MDFLNRFSNKIEAQQWDHLQYLKRLTLVMVFTIFLLYLTILMTTLSGSLPSDFVKTEMTILTKSILIGIISGVVLGLLILLKPYVEKNWDLHIVVPNFLFYFLLLIILLIIILSLLNIDSISSPAYILGSVLGGFIDITAYAGEVSKEHS